MRERVISAEEPRILLLSLDPDERIGKFLGKLLRDHFRIDRLPLSSAAGALLGCVPRELAGPAVLLPVSETVDERLLGLVSELREKSFELPILAAVEKAGTSELLALLEQGAADFVTAPFSSADLAPRLCRLSRLAGSPGGVMARLKEKLGLQRLVGESPAFLALLQRIPLAARCDASVLLTGETGTGKEVVARAVHYLGPRAGKPFLPVNCGALPLELVENELFGHRRSAFTGADADRPGVIAEAEGGTLFLDEIDALPPTAQVKLLRFLQEGEYRPLGAPRPRTADLRLIAATNTDVEAALADGRLREDLYYRLNVLRLALPPLAERRDDIPLLARHFAAKHAAALGRPSPTLAPAALQVLQLRDWPGNVRQLEHAVERAVVLAEGRLVLGRADVLPDDPRRGGAAPRSPSFKEAKAAAVARFERDYLEDLLRAHDGNISGAARAAKKNRRAFFELIKKHHIDASRFRRP